MKDAIININDIDININPYKNRKDGPSAEALTKKLKQRVNNTRSITGTTEENIAGNLFGSYSYG